MTFGTRLRVTGLLFALTMGVAACSATATRPSGDSGVVFDSSVERTQKAAVDALTVLGFEVKTQQNVYVEGFRPRKVGFFVGSGGETVGVWLEPHGKQQTRVLATTAKSFVGLLGQKDWTDKVLAQMSHELTSAN